MIFEYALEPALVASWHDPAKWRFFDGKFGLGTRRIGCALPSPGWRELVLLALEDEMKSAAPAAQQNARKRLETLLGHITREMTKRATVAPPDSPWLDAAIAEHGAYPFQGIVARSFAAKGEFALTADTLNESSLSRWNPRHTSTLRQVHDVSQTLAPILRSCVEARFVDPYFDANIEEFAEPFTSFLALLRSRRSTANMKIELHLAVRSNEVDAVNRTLPDVAREKSSSCRTKFASLLAPGMSLRVFAWSENVARSDKLHNRYILTNLGGVAVQTGLDRARRGSAHTDDLTLLSREQYLGRWDQYREGSTAFCLELKPPMSITLADAIGVVAAPAPAKPMSRRTRY